MHDIFYKSSIPEALTAGFISQNQRAYSPDISNSLTLEEALTYLEDEIRALPVSKATIYSYFDDVKNPRQRSQSRKDSAFAISLTINQQEFTLVSSHWQLPEQNVYALHMVLRQLHNCEKWHIATTPQLFAGFSKDSVAAAASTSSNYELPEWMTYLGLGPSATPDDVTAIYHKRAKSLDGDEEGLRVLNEQVEEARHALGVK